MLVRNLPVANVPAADRVVEAIKSLRNWRSLEVFGPPGSGKSHLCRHASVTLGALTMCDRQAVSFYAAMDLPRITALAETILSQRRMRNYLGLHLRLYSRGYWRSAGAAAQAYLSAVERVRDAFPLPTDARKRFDNRVQGSAALIDRASADGRQIIADEGLLNQLNSAIARTVVDWIDERQRNLVRACLDAYPWEKTALIVDALPETCIRRQQARGHSLFTHDRPQPVFHRVTDMLEGLCGETGWRTVRVNND